MCRILCSTGRRELRRLRPDLSDGGELRRVSVYLPVWRECLRRALRRHTDRPGKLRWVRREVRRDMHERKL
jgi:hypothetical protein